MTTTCATCGKTIPSERLEAVPGVETCVKCSVARPYTENDVDVDLGLDVSDMQRSAFTSTKGN